MRQLVGVLAVLLKRGWLDDPELRQPFFQVAGSQSLTSHLFVKIRNGVSSTQNPLENLDWSEGIKFTVNDCIAGRMNRLIVQIVIGGNRG